ncbi:hypothetical protein E3N88_17865 [Mikania micrantha]|uniref:50S ribosomal protein L18 n=1 Tax=Mikania micrantha TaxID=192012 RepID=A0A5N6NUE6_9ASTR|nr:hypothetical protein E3N88_17865 [Mikania micrantha]
MVIPPPVKAQRITNFLKPYLLKMHFSNKYVSAQVIHSPTATVASAASSQEKALREAWTKTQQSTRDVAAAAKIGKLLGERLLLKDIPAVSVVYKKNQRYHGKVRAVIDSLREAGMDDYDNGAFSRQRWWWVQFKSHHQWQVVVLRDLRVEVNEEKRTKNSHNNHLPVAAKHPITEGTSGTAKLLATDATPPTSCLCP